MALPSGLFSLSWGEAGGVLWGGEVHGVDKNLPCVLSSTSFAEEGVSPLLLEGVCS